MKPSRTRNQTAAKAPRPHADAQTAERTGMPLWQPMLIIVGGLLAYATSFTGAFIFDDLRNIVNNPWLQDPERVIEGIARSRRPVLTATFAVNYALGGTNPVGYHIVNIIIHLLAALTLYGLIRRTIALPVFSVRWQRSTGFLAMACALLWVVHPLTTQGVTYITQRGESLMALFYLLTLYLFLRGATASRPLGWFLLAAAACALGMGTKAVMISAPILVLIFDRTFLAGTFREALRRRWPVHAALFATLIVLYLTGVALAVLGIKPTGTGPTTVGFGTPEVTPVEYAMTQPGVILHYLKLALVPYDQALDDKWPIARTLAWRVVFAALAVGGGLFVSLWGLWRRKWWGFAGFAAFLILAPTSSLIPIRDASFEHRMYLPLAFFIIVVVGVFAGLLGRDAERSGLPPRLALIASLGALLIPTAVLGVVTLERNRLYQDPLDMWRDVVRKRPHNDRAMINLAALEYQRNPTPEGAHRAIDLLIRSLKVRPDNTTALQRLGYAYHAAGETTKAQSMFNRALSVGLPGAGPYREFGNELLRLGYMQHALQAARQAVALRPESAANQYLLGASIEGIGEPAAALGPLRAAVRIDPAHAHAYYLIGYCHERLGQDAEAVDAYTQAMSIAPEMLEARINLANLLPRFGRSEEAVEVLDEGTRFTGPGATPELRDRLYFNLGNTLLNLRRLEEAIDAYQQAIALNPVRAAAHYGKGYALFELRRLEEAQAAFLEATRIEPGHAQATQALRLVERAILDRDRVQQRIAQ